MESERFFNDLNKTTLGTILAVKSECERLAALDFRLLLSLKLLFSHGTK